ncbi:MAG: LysR family transcriptional regulator [Nevskiales bacterium]
MDTQLLLAFIAVAEAGSFTRAAEQLHLSQPAISKRIAALEAQCGGALFDRIGREIRLTEAGRTLLPYAHRSQAEIEDAGRALTHLTGQVAGRLSIGTSHHIGLHRLPAVLRDFTQRYPAVDLDLHFMDSEEACHAVEQGKLELGIVTLPLDPIARLEQRLVWPDPMAFVVATDHPLAWKRRLGLQELAGYPAILPDEKTYTHRIVQAALRRHGISPRVRLATNYLETLKMLVGIGLGWSVLPQSMLDSSLRTLRISAMKLKRELGWVRHRERTLSGPARALLSLLDEQKPGRSRNI